MMKTVNELTFKEVLVINFENEFKQLAENYEVSLDQVENTAVNLYSNGQWMIHRDNFIKIYDKEVSLLFENKIIDWDEMGFLLWLSSRFTIHEDTTLRNGDMSYCSQKDIIDQSGKAKATISKIMKNLIEKKLIFEKKHGEYKNGKRYYISSYILYKPQTGNGIFENSHKEFLHLLEKQLYTQFINSMFKTEENKKIELEFPKDEIRLFKEKDLEEMLLKDLSVIEYGLILIDNQYQVENGYIDILAKDKDDKLCIIELKIVPNDSKLIEQCVYYPTQFSEKVRMISIAPDYINKITNSLKSLGYVEMKTFEIDNGKVKIHDYV